MVCRCVIKGGTAEGYDGLTGGGLLFMIIPLGGHRICLIPQRVLKCTLPEAFHFILSDKHYCSALSVITKVQCYHMHTGMQGDVQA